MQQSKYLINRNPNQSLSKIKPHFGAPIPMGIFFPTTNSTCLESLKHLTHDNWLVIWLLIKPLGFFITSLILTPIIYFWISTPSIKVHGTMKIQFHKDIRFSTKGHSSPSIQNVILIHNTPNIKLMINNHTWTTTRFKVFILLSNSELCHLLFSLLQFLLLDWCPSKSQHKHNNTIENLPNEDPKHSKCYWTIKTTMFIICKTRKNKIK
jgi:hypothetical protein